MEITSKGEIMNNTMQYIWHIIAFHALCILCTIEINYNVVGSSDTCIKIKAEIAHNFKREVVLQYNNESSRLIA